MKLTITLGLLAFWVFALVTPSMITLIEKNENTFVFNLNEEEQKFRFVLSYLYPPSTSGYCIASPRTACLKQAPPIIYSHYPI